MVPRPRLHDRSSWGDSTPKDSLGRDENHSSPRGKHSFLWFKVILSTISVSRERHSLDLLRFARLVLERLCDSCMSTQEVTKLPKHDQMNKETYWKGCGSDRRGSVSFGPCYLHSEQNLYPYQAMRSQELKQSNVREPPLLRRVLSQYFPSSSSEPWPRSTPTAISTPVQIFHKSLTYESPFREHLFSMHFHREYSEGWYSTIQSRVGDCLFSVARPSRTEEDL